MTSSQIAKRVLKAKVKKVKKNKNDPTNDDQFKNIAPIDLHTKDMIGANTMWYTD